MYCHNCGNQVADTDKFCFKCGAKLVYRSDNRFTEASTRTKPDNAPRQPKAETAQRNPALLTSIQFYNDCVDDFHSAAREYGISSGEVSFVPELIPIGEKTVLAFLKDNFFQRQYSSNPELYYSVIMSIVMKAGMLFAEKWHTEFSELEKYVASFIENYTVEDCDPLLERLGLSDSKKANDFNKYIYERWKEKHAPYWELTDPREYTFKAMLAAYQLGVSLVLERLLKPQSYNQESNTVDVMPRVQYKELYTERIAMTKAVPGEYYFCGTPTKKGETLKLLAPVTVDIEDAYKNGIKGLNSWDGIYCFKIAETPEYIFYKYRCHDDGSGGCNIRQSKSNPRETLFFGKSKMFGCVFHDYLIQVDKSAYGDELYVYAKEIHTGQEKIYKWLGKYSIATGRGSRYDQDHVQNLRIDTVSDTIVLDVKRTKCPYITNPNEEDQLTNIDTDYILTINYQDGDFHAVATYPTNILQIFDNKYESQQEESPKTTFFAELGEALRAAEAVYADKSEIEKVITQYGSKKGNQFLSVFATFYLKIAPKVIDASEKKSSKIMSRFITNIKMKYGMSFLMEYDKFYKANSSNEKLLKELLNDVEKYYDKTLLA